MLKLTLTIASGILGIWLADQLVAGVDFMGDWKSLLSAGIILGLINFFIKPILKLIALPIRMLTLGMAGMLINVGVIWILDIIFTELIIVGIIPLLWTTAIVWGTGIVFSFFFPKKKNVQ